ncbi:MAG TPA: hypothetical protein PLS40_13125, partial [Bacteroidia bacterium]|nr:hypothetical protein [Bacteroidia bacterium]
MQFYLAGYDADSNYTGDLVAYFDTVYGVSSGLSGFTADSSLGVVYNPTLVGSGYMRARYYNNASGYIADTTGLITVLHGDTARLVIEDARFSSQAVGADTLTADQTLRLYAASYDGDGNFIGNLQSTAWSLSGGIGSLNTALSDTVILTASNAGSGSVRASYNGLSDETGLITVIGGDTSYILIRTGARNSGNVFSSALTLKADSSLVLHAAGYDADNNYLGPVYVSWSLAAHTVPSLSNFTPVSDTVLTYVPALVGSDSIIAQMLGDALRDTTGLITVVPGDTAMLLVETMRNGNGVSFPNLVSTADSVVTGYALYRDIKGNVIDSATSGIVWSVSGRIGSIVQEGLDSAVLRLDTVGVGQLRAVAGGFSASSGFIRVSPGILYSVKLMRDTLLLGDEVDDFSISVGDSIKLYAAAFDSNGNFRGNIASSYAAHSGTLQSSRLFIRSDSTSVVFWPSTASTGRIYVTSNYLGISDSSGVVTVTNTAAVAGIRINSEAHNTGTEVLA